ncbi:DedA family protein [Mucilaginibacter sp. P25]|uniref:DedA family protein n=1 Tax=Mucilaginibacter sp. P25 TaxID=3423945 RepID=UPI003D79E416
MDLSDPFPDHICRNRFCSNSFLPGDSLLFAAGALIAGGSSGLDIWLLGIILIAAAFIGNTVNYLLGNYLGPKVFKEENKILKLEYYLKTKAFLINMAVRR